MNRNIRKYVEDYDKMFRNKNRGALYASDIMALADLAEEQDAQFFAKTKNRTYQLIGANTLILAIENALQVGMVIGYRCAKYEARKKKG